MARKCEEEGNSDRSSVLTNPTLKDATWLDYPDKIGSTVVLDVGEAGASPSNTVSYVEAAHPNTTYVVRVIAEQ